MAGHKKKADPEVTAELVAEPVRKQRMTVRPRPEIKEMFAEAGKVNAYEVASSMVIDGVVRNIFTQNGHSCWRDDSGRIRRLKKYNTDIELVEQIESWEQYLCDKLNEGENIIPDAELLAAYLDVTVNQLKRWEQGERGEAFQNIIGAEMNKIAAAKNQMAMRGAIPVVVWATQMNNNHGYTQNSKQEVIVTRHDKPNVDALIASAKLLPD
jgi:hypothetical protein